MLVISLHGLPFPERLQACRKACGMTQQDVADTLGFDRSSYAYYETGKTRPDYPTLCRLAEIYGISVSSLLSEDALPETETETEDTGTLHDSPLVIAGYDESDECEVSPEELLLLAQYRRLSGVQKQYLNQFMRSLLPESGE